MLSGALLLFAIAVIQAVRKENEGLEYVIATFAGYGLLIAGFSLAMRARRDARELKREVELEEAKHPETP
jgi:hypothetical protein